jgi:hypothetical protein
MIANSAHKLYDYDFCSYPILEDKEDRRKTSMYSNEDALPNQVFEGVELIARAPPSIKRPEADRIENITVQIFAHLYSIADQVQRTEVENAVASNISYSPSSPQLENFKFTHAEILHPSARETNFFEENNLEQPLSIQNIVSDILSSASYLFCGWNLFNHHMNNPTPQEMKSTLYKDNKFWKEGLKRHYSKPFAAEMKKVFRIADKLLQSRIEDEKWAFIQRLTLYATLIIAAIGKLSGHKAVLIFGLSAVALTLLFMITHYGTASFKQDQQGADLRQSINRVYSTAVQHRKDDTSNSEDLTEYL